MLEQEDVSGTQEEFVVYHNSARLKALAVYMALVAYGVPIFLVTDAYRHGTANAAMWIFCILFVSAFSAMLVNIVRLLISPQPAVVINIRGILDNAAPAGATGFTPWSDIQQAYIRGNGFIRAIHIVPCDRKQLFAGKPLSVRINMLTRQMQPGAAPIQIATVLLPVSAEELLAAIQKQEPRLSANRIG